MFNCNMLLPRLCITHSTLNTIKNAHAQCLLQIIMLSKRVKIKNNFEQFSKTIQSTEEYNKSHEYCLHLLNISECFSSL